MRDWPFSDPENIATYTVRQIAREGRPILRVSHDADDGAWQFLERDAPAAEDMMIVSLAQIVVLDPSVKELADLPLGWMAHRRDTSEPWQREPAPAKERA